MFLKVRKATLAVCILALRASHFADFTAQVRERIAFSTTWYLLAVLT